MMCFYYHHEHGCDVYCERCAREIIIPGLDTSPEDVAELWEDPSTIENQDIPEHCCSGDGCLERIEVDGEYVGKLIDYNMSKEGIAYIKNKLREGKPAARLWFLRYCNQAGLKIFT